MLPAAILVNAINYVQNFGKENKGVKNHGKGSPHPQVWRHVLQSPVQLSQNRLEILVEVDREFLTQALAIVQAHLKAFTDSGPKKAYFHIRQAMVRTTRNESESILKFEIPSLAEDSRKIQMALIYLTETAGGRVLEGTAAPTDHERKMQQHIATLKARVPS